MKTNYSLFFGALTGLLLGQNAMGQSAMSPARAALIQQKNHPHAVAALRGGGLANDECAGAIVLTVGTDCTPTSGDFTAATQSLDPITCNTFTSTGANDAWYSFVATSDYTTVSVTGNTVDTGVDPILEVFSGTCGALVSEGCSDATVIGETEQVEQWPTTIGSTYYYRVYYWIYDVAPEDFGFTTCVQEAEAPPPAPENDLCTSATPEALVNGSSLTFTGDVTSATLTGDFEDGSSIGSTALPTVWHAFTTTECSKVTVSYCGTPSVFNNVWIFLSTNCPTNDDLVIGTYDFTTCSDGNATVVYPGLPAGTWYLPVMFDEANGATGPYTINVAGEACPAPPPNDECATAISIPSGTTCVTTEGTVLGATQSMDPLLCNGYTSTNAIDVWYSFEATTTSEYVTVQGTEAFDAVVELFEGNCGGLTSIGCADATILDPLGAIEEIYQEGFVIGNTYYVRLYSYNNATTTPGFTICVKSTSVGINEAATPVQFSVFPNPTDGDFTLTYGDATGVVTMDLMDMAGRTVFSQQRTLAQGQNVTLPLAGKLASGAYNLRLTTATSRSSQRLMVK